MKKTIKQIVEENRKRKKKNEIPATHKITAHLNKEILAQALEISGETITSTVEDALKAYIQRWACKEMVKQKGKHPGLKAPPREDD